MKSLTLIFALVPTLVFASKIPLNSFEQAKLETLLRNIPTSLVKSEKKEGFVRKHYSFPKNKKASFLISCYADYFANATIPSSKVCEVEVSDKATTDESMFKITDATMVNELTKAIPYGDKTKRFASHERVYGQAYDGVYRNHFRHAFLCKVQSCEVSFSTKEPIE